MSMKLGSVKSGAPLGAAHGMEGADGVGRRAGTSTDAYDVRARLADAHGSMRTAQSQGESHSDHACRRVAAVPHDGGVGGVRTRETPPLPGALEVKPC